MRWLGTLLQRKPRAKKLSLDDKIQIQWDEYIESLLTRLEAHRNEVSEMAASQRKKMTPYEVYKANLNKPYTPSPYPFKYLQIDNYSKPTFSYVQFTGPLMASTSGTWSRYFNNQYDES